MKYQVNSTKLKALDYELTLVFVEVPEDVPLGQIAEYLQRAMPDRIVLCAHPGFWNYLLSKYIMTTQRR